jgi:hypothetical protein
MGAQRSGIFAAPECIQRRRIYAGGILGPRVIRSECLVMGTPPGTAVFQRSPDLA